MKQENLKSSWDTYVLQMKLDWIYSKERYEY